MRIGKVILKTYVGVAGTIVLAVFLLSLLKVVPNLQYSRGAVIRNSFGFIYPTDFRSPLFLPLCRDLLFAKRQVYWLTISEWRSSSSLLSSSVTLV